ncbi:MAG: hypothetical protein AAGH74_09500 [Pseudomonadota bacterium]
MSWGSRLMLLLPALLGGALIWQAAQVAPAPERVQVEERRVPVSYISAAPVRFRPQISGFGTVAPAKVWTAVAQVTGPIDYVSPAFVRGGFVRAGEVLLRTGAEDAQLALESAEADLANAHAQLEEMAASRHTTLSALSIERESLELADADLARTLRLAERGVVSDSIVQTQHRDLLAQRAKVQSLEATLQLLPAQIAAQEQMVAKARVARQSAGLDVARTIIRAPFDARVARVDVEISQFVTAGAVMGSLDGIAFAEVDTQVSQREALTLDHLAKEFGGLASGASHDAGPLEPAALQRISAQGQAEAVALTAQVVLETEQGRFAWPAEIARISDSVDPETRAIGVIVRVANPYGQSGPAQPPLIKGTFARVELAAPPIEGAILLPRAAIKNGRVMVVDAGDRLDWLPVAPIFASDGIAVLAPGALAPQTRIITSQPSPAIKGLLLDPQLDQRMAGSLAEAPAGPEL